VVYLGFYLGQLLTLPRFITVFTGYLPDIGTEFYIILIVVFATLAVLFSGKNLYCKSVCPFGAAQDIIGHIGGAKAFRPKRYRIFKSLQWGITLAAILLALSINNPGVAEYSVFGAFFQLTAASTIFILLIITIALSLFIKRPWCNYLCPIDGVFAYFRTLRRALLNLFSI
jgi:polyferredoxin